MSWSNIARVSVLIATAFEISANFAVPIDGYDHFSQLSWLVAFPNLIRAGILAPHWLPSAFGNFGSPTFYFYPPFAYYLSTAISFVTTVQDPTTLYRFVALFISLASVWTCYLFLRGQGASKNSAFFGGMLFAFAPFQAFILFTFNAFGSHVSFAILPLVLLFVDRVLRKNSDSVWRDFGLLSLTWGLMILTSIPISTLLGFTVLFILLIQIRTARLSRIALATLALASGTLLAGFYLVPIPYLLPEIHLSALFTQPDNPPLVYTFLTELPHGKNVSENLQDLLVWIANIVMFVVFWKIRKLGHSSGSNERASLSMAGLGLIIFLLVVQYPLIHSALTGIVPFYRLIQFSLRWDIVTCLIFALVWAVIRNPIDQRKFSIVILFWSAIVSIIMVAQMSHFRIHREEGQHINSDPPEYIPVWGSMSQNSVFFMAQRHKNDPFVLTDSKDQSSKISLLEQTPIHSVLKSNFSHPTVVTFHQWYWPQWVLETQSSRLTSTPDSIGRLTTVVPPGQQLINLTLETTSAEITGRWVSIIGAVCILVFSFLLWQTRNRSRPKVSE